MLQYIRDRSTGWVAWVVVTLIIIPFALWGVYDYMSPSRSVAIAAVNGVEIDLRQFNRLYQQNRHQLQTRLGDAFDVETFGDALLREQTLERLIDDELLIQSGIDDGLRISDSQLARAISTMPRFQSENGFSLEIYDAYLRVQGLSPLGFEYEMRRGLLFDQIAAAVARNVRASTHEQRKVQRLDRQRRTYSLLRVAADAHRPSDIEEKEINAYHEANQSRFSSAEQVNVEYVALSRAAMERSVVVDDPDLNRLYEERKSNYVQPAQRNASHILVRLPDDADEESEAAALEKMDRVLQQLAEGRPFEELAKRHSEDPGSARQGGALGWFSAGVMEPAFEEAAFDLAEGEISDVVRTRFGLHLIRVTGRRESGVVEFEQIREQLLSDYRNEVAEQLFFEQAERLANLAFEHPDTLEVAAEALGAALVETGLISRSPGDRSGLSAEARFIDAAFSPEVLAEGNNSELLEFDGLRVAVLRVKEHQPSRQLPLEQVKENVKAELMMVLGAEAARRKGVDLVSRLRNGESAETVATELGLEWTPEEQVGRTDSALSPTLRSLLFRIPKPGASAPIYDGMQAENGDFVVVELRGVETGDEEVPGTLVQSAAQLSSQLGSADFAATVAGLRADADIVVNEEGIR